jgi:DNA-binding FadR family transcriptional regulator
VLRVVQPTLAEMIAGTLRDRILAGEIDGTLPRQEDLVAEFEVSPPSVREALRILQAEGLVTVKRGNVGGAHIHVPRPGKVAYILGMILQSQGTYLEDIGAAIGILEPACAQACATRRDRATQVVPALMRTVEESHAALDDPVEYMRLSLRFHEELVAGCGNTTLTVVLGALDSLLSAHLQTLAARTTALGVFREKATRTASYREHAELARLIAAGDGPGAERAARSHLSHSEWRGRILGRRTPVRAGLLRDR